MLTLSTHFYGFDKDRHLTKEELLHALWCAIAAESESIQFYLQLAASLDNALAVEVLKSIAAEKRVHVGKVMRLLKHLAPEESQFHAEGERAVEEMMGQIGKGTVGAQESKPPEKDQTPKPEEEPQADLPYCRTAPAAEHARWHEDDEPCDDARAGKLDEE